VRSGSVSDCHEVLSRQPPKGGLRELGRLPVGLQPACAHNTRLLAPVAPLLRRPVAQPARELSC
jgi:hypothetical protein